MKQRFNAECKARILEQFPNVKEAHPFWSPDGDLFVGLTVGEQKWIYNAAKQTFDKAKDD